MSTRWLLLCSLLFATAGLSQTFSVSDVAGFRQALEDAAVNGENDKIVLSKGVYKTTDDSFGTFSFSDKEEFNLTIESAEGLQHPDVIMDGNNATRVLLFNNTMKSSLFLTRLSVRNGFLESEHGAGISTNQDLVVTDCNITNNHINNIYLGDGGGLYSLGSVIVKNTTISNNSAVNGGGFYGLNASVNNSRISHNSAIVEGGGFKGDNAIVIDSTIFSNSTLGTGLYEANGAGFYAKTVELNNSALFDNIAKDDGGGFFATTATINNSNFTNNSADSGGGNLCIHSTINASTYDNNRAEYGAGIYNPGSLVVNDSTFLDNNANKDGGGFYSGGPYDYGSYSGSLLVNHSKFLNNHARDGAGIKSGSRTVLVLSNSMFLNNTHNLDDSSAVVSLSGRSEIINNSLISSDVAISAKGIFVNNIFDNNSVDIIIEDTSSLMNNYIDYTKVVNPGFSVIQKNNLQPENIGRLYLTDENTSLTVNSPVIDKGMNLDSQVFQDILEDEYNSEKVYEYIKEMLRTDIFGNPRVYNGTIDIGPHEYGSQASEDTNITDPSDDNKTSVTDPSDDEDSTDSSDPNDPVDDSSTDSDEPTETTVSDSSDGGGSGGGALGLVIPFFALLVGFYRRREQE